MVYDNQIVAFIACKLYDDFYSAHIVFSYTDEEHRRKGLNYTLAYALIKLLHEKGMADILTSLSAGSYTIRKRLSFKEKHIKWYQNKNFAT